MKWLWNKLRVLFWTFYGEVLKLLVRIGCIKPLHGINTSPRQRPIIVSLTSYGRRVSDVVHFTIISLLRQSFKPDAIILWLDDDNWNADNIPQTLQALIPYGLTIKFCKDLRSFKKLVPALDAFPDALHITFDDDIYYNHNVIEGLVKAHEAHPHSICAYYAHQPMVGADGSLLPYQRWPHFVSEGRGLTPLVTGGAGAIYSRELLHTDVCRDDLFMRLCPYADDIWFYFMEVLQGTPVHIVPSRKRVCIPVDNIYQLTHSHSRLAADNCGASRNDTQLHAIMQHYGLTTDDFRIAP